jgi:transposase-like protein
MKDWTQADFDYYYQERDKGKSVKAIARKLGVTESALYHMMSRKEGRGIDLVQPEDTFSYEDVHSVTGIPLQTIESLIECKKLRGNGTVERKDLINFVIRYPGECGKGNPIQLIYLLGGDKCSPNLM